MKKFLLLAAATVALGASAQTLTQNWKSTANLQLTTNDVRQGVGMDGKVYINNKGDQTVYIIDQNGLQDKTLPGGANCGINRDDAGNLVVSNAAFPGTWSTEAPVFKVYDPTQADPEVTELTITADIASMGRDDMIGSAMGDLTADGEILLVGSTSNGIGKLTVANGETDEDNSYIAICEGVTFGNLVVVHPLDAEDEDGNLLAFYVARNAAPALLKEDGDNYTVVETFPLENKGACNGAELFMLGENMYVVYPTLPNYQDGFAIACVDEEAKVDGVFPAVATKAPEFQANPNGFQANWLNVELVDEYTAIIYQYVPGGYVEQYTFAIEPSGIKDVTANDTKVRKVYENGQIYIINGDAKYNVMGAQVK